MNIDQLIEHLTTWNPPNTLLGPSPEGLGRELTAAVKAAPPRWALHAAKFKGLHPTYVRHFLDGFFEIAVIGAGVGQDAVLDWAPVLDLCRWAAPATAPTGTSPRHPLDLDRDWQGTHLTIARLVYECCGSGGIGVPIELRETVWAAIEPLMSSPDPSLERESQFLQQESADAVLLAMNSVRGEALHAVFRYADWVRKRQIPCSGRDDTFGIDNLPEVKAVLELRLKPDIEPSLAVRSVYGQWLPLLFAIDNAWLAAQVQAVFPQTPETVDLRQAAWEGFVTTCPPSRELYELLKPEYERAINRLGIDVPGRRGMREPNKWLAQHLIWLYAVGVIELNDDSPLTTFFALAPDELRAMAMDFVADTSRPPDNYPPFTARLMALWEHRLAIAAKAKSTVDFTKELAAFGSSFASRVFDDAWALDQLEAVLTLVGNVEPDHLVVERLAELSDLRLSETLRTLELLIMGVTEEWRIYGWQQGAMTVLQNGLKATDPTVKTAATQLINRLVSRGHQEFLTLLS